MPTDRADKVRAAITNLDKKKPTGCSNPAKHLASSTEGKLAADELAVIHGFRRLGLR
jgi:hypothetical protein